MQNKPCDGCAFTEGAAANREPHNQLRGRICAHAGIPFYCHSGEDWQDGIALKIKIMRRERVPTCAGWRRDVAKLASIGHFRDDGAAQREVGKIALATMDRWIETDEQREPDRKAMLLKRFGDALSALFGVRL